MCISFKEKYKYLLCEKYIDTFKILNIELASEFIVMAANLMYIKSRTLLPRNEQAPEEDIDEEDPRWELIRQLVEYKKFKDAANYLEKREVENQKFYSAEQQFCDDLEEEGEPIVNVGIFELIQAFQGVLKRFDDEDDLTEIADDRFTVSDKIDYLITNVSKGQKVKFYQLFEEASTKSEVLVTFLALLELIRLNEFQVRQNGVLGEIELTRSNLDEI